MATASDRMSWDQGHGMGSASLLERCRRGDDDAATTLVREWQPRVFDLAARLVGNLEEGEAITQEALWRTLAATRSPKGAPVDSFGAYAMRTARNLAIDRLRHRAVVRRTPIDPPGLDPMPDPGELEHLRELVQGLDDELQQIVELRYVEELSFGQMAERLGMSKNGVFARHARALDALRERLLGRHR